MQENHAFVFTCNDAPFGNAARTLKEFVTLLERAPEASLDGHGRRGDFSRWIAEVFGDQPLAAAIRKIERRLRRGDIANLRAALIGPIRERYELTDFARRAAVGDVPTKHAPEGKGIGEVISGRPPRSP